MRHLQHQAHLPDEPDFLGLTPEQARRLATERGLTLRRHGEGYGYAARANIDGQRVTAEIEGGVIVYAQRF